VSSRAKRGTSPTIASYTIELVWSKIKREILHFIQDDTGTKAQVPDFLSSLRAPFNGTAL
jgi:hypothetical protein